MRATSRVVGCSITTVAKLLRDAGIACGKYHDETVRKVKTRNLQLDEIWAFCYAKQKTTEQDGFDVKGAGDVWTWTAIDSDTKLIISYVVGDRSADTAAEFISDLDKRILKNPKPQITTDGFKSYIETIKDILWGKAHYAQLLKIYDEDEGVLTQWKRPIMGKPKMDKIGTSFVERQNLNIRMGNRRFTRLTNAFSKRVLNHLCMLHIYFVYYNFVRVHLTLETTPAVKAGIADKKRDMEWMIDIVDAMESKPKRPKRYKKQQFT